MQSVRAKAWTASGFDWAVTAASAGIVVGGWLDAWAHQHLRSTLETFATPWHGVLYSGLFATSVVLIVGVARGRAAGRAWRKALPRGIGASVVPQQQFRFVPVAAVVGVVWDGLRSVLRPTAARRGPLRVFAFSAPAVLFALYFADLAFTERIVWSVHTWAGSVVLAGVAGLLASLAVCPP